MKTFKYSEIRPELQTFDLVFFNGNGFAGWVIKLFSRSKYTHCGVIVRYEDIKIRMDRYREGSLLFFESTTLGKSKDVLSRKNEKGVQLIYFSDKIKNYNGDILIKRLQGERTEEMKICLNEFILETHYRPYEKKMSELFFACLKYVNPKENLSTIFCSELCVELYQKIKLFSEKLKSNSFTPGRLFGLKLDNKKYKFLRTIGVKYE